MTAIDRFIAQLAGSGPSDHMQGAQKAGEAEHLSSATPQVDTQHDHEHSVRWTTEIETLLSQLRSWDTADERRRAAQILGTLGHVRTAESPATMTVECISHWEEFGLKAMSVLGARINKSMKDILCGLMGSMVVGVPSGWWLVCMLVYGWNGSDELLAAVAIPVGLLFLFGLLSLCANVRDIGMVVRVFLARRHICRMLLSFAEEITTRMPRLVCLRHLLRPDTAYTTTWPTVFPRCRACGAGQFHWWREHHELVVTLDAVAKDIEIDDGTTLRINWLLRRELFDFDRVEIVNATDEDVERFDAQVRNDSDEFRRGRYRSIPCFVHPQCRLSENTLRILRSTFGSLDLTGSSSTERPLRHAL